ncbi:glutaredoxin [bacterium]|nr:glutaredoxin [bacterium]
MKTATLYRMVTDKHICPFGIRSKHLLKKQGYKVKDIHLKSREETDEFKEKHGVETTPQAFIDNKRIGGYESLLKYFNQYKEKPETTYTPVTVVFIIALFIAWAMQQFSLLEVNLVQLFENFVALSMCLLAMLKLRDLYAFTNQFITYDLLGMRYLPYAYVYPFMEAAAGVLMLANLWPLLSSAMALTIGLIGSISVIKAVYIDQRELKCACVGGKSNVPLGFISLSENLIMVSMSIWLLIK